MSQALASARKRRAPPPEIPPPVAVSGRGGPTLPAGTGNIGLTLPQVITFVDQRLMTLEKYMRDTQEAEAAKPQVQANPDIPAIEEILTEFNSRFAMLAEELNNLKNIVLKLHGNVVEKLIERFVIPVSDSSPELGSSSSGNAPASQQPALVVEPTATNTNKSYPHQRATDTASHYTYAVNSAVPLGQYQDTYAVNGAVPPGQYQDTYAVNAAVPPGQYQESLKSGPISYNNSVPKIPKHALVRSNAIYSYGNKDFVEVDDDRLDEPFPAFD